MLIISAQADGGPRSLYAHAWRCNSNMQKDETHFYLNALQFSRQLLVQINCCCKLEKAEYVNQLLKPWKGNVFQLRDVMVL